MSTKYLLPCRCGRQMIVEPREAGRTSACPCGQPVLIPTMLEITRLEPAPDETSQPTKRAWGWQHGLFLCGVAIVVLAVVLAGVFRWLRPVARIDAIDPETVRQSAHELSPLRTWHYWELMKQGLDRRVDQIYAEKLSLYHIGQGFAGTLALIGIALIGTGVAIGRNRGGEGERGRRGETPK